MLSLAREPRPLAPHFTSMDDFIEAARASVRSGAAVDIRLSPTTRKQGKIDLQSASLAVQVWDKLTDKSKAAFTKKHGTNPARFCQLCWDLVSKGTISVVIK